MSEPVVSIVIPAYNEGAGIKQAVREVLNYFAANARFLLKEIIVVDDGSLDDTGEQLMACRDWCQSLVVVKHPRNEGKGAVQLLFLRGLWGTQCGFKLLRASAAKNIFRHARISGFAFDVEFL
jgi:cellulose synthase/poly-beta-1,6-N-acetylglucosamine synthase-like glycosyltransferase